MDNKSDSKAMEFINILNYMDFTQHVTGPTHSHGHTLDLVITHGLTVDVSSIVDMAMSDHYCVFFFGTAQKNTERLVKKRCLTPEVSANVMTCLESIPAVILPSSYDDLVNHLTTRLKTTIDVIYISPVRERN